MVFTGSWINSTRMNFTGSWIASFRFFWRRGPAGTRLLKATTSLILTGLRLHNFWMARIAGGAALPCVRMIPTTGSVRSAGGGMTTRTATGAGTLPGTGIPGGPTFIWPCVRGARRGIYKHWGHRGILTTNNGVICVFGGFSRCRRRTRCVCCLATCAIASRASSPSPGVRSGARFRVSRESGR